jgi:elongation factor P--beta-lysine ligase
MEDTEHLVAYIAEQRHGTPHLAFHGRSIDLTPPWERITVREAFRRSAAVDLEAAQGEADLRRIARQKGYPNVEDADWETLFHLILLQEVEPSLGRGRPTFLLDYPDRLSAMAKRKEEAPCWVERCELYIEGIELANGYTELNDPHEQRTRLVTEQAQKAREGYDAPLDEELLYALERGMPPSGGMALGVDRMLMILTDRTSLEEVITFPFSQM